MRTIDRPRPVAASSENPSGSPTPSSTTVARRRPPSFVELTTTRPGSACRSSSAGNAWSMAFCRSSFSTTESGVATVGGEEAGVALHGEAHRAVLRRHALLDHASEGAHDLHEGDVVARLPRQRLVHERDGADAPHRLLDRHLRLRRAEPAALQPQQRRDRLQVVLHPVVDLADRRRPSTAAADRGDAARTRPAVSTTAPDTAPWSMSGMQRISTDTSACPSAPR